MYRKLVYGFGVLFWLLTFGLLLLHFVVKDSSYKAALWFYAFPLPLIILIAVLAALCLPKQIKRYGVTVVLVLVLLWLGRSLKLNVPKELQSNAFEVLFWNAAHDNSFENAIAINGQLPDVAVLVEYSGKDIALLKTAYPDLHTYEDTIQNIGLFSKTPIIVKKITRSKYQSAVLYFETKGINFYAVDVSGSIDVPRAWEMDLVCKAISSFQNAIVLGDFNVPLESELLKPIASNFDHAFSKKGWGLRETWCFGLPILSLDHVWVSRDLKINRVSKTHTLQSDHAMLSMIVLE